MSPTERESETERPGRLGEGDRGGGRSDGETEGGREDRKGETRQETVDGIEQEKRRRSDSPEGKRRVIKEANVRIWINGCSQRATESWL